MRGKMTKRTEPELHIKTTLAKFAGFLKALIFIAIVAGGTSGTTYLTNDKIDSDLIAENKARDSIIDVLQHDIKEHDIRIDNVEKTNVEVKTSLVDIQKDIKTLLYITGKNEGYRSR